VIERVRLCVLALSALAAPAVAQEPLLVRMWNGEHPPHQAEVCAHCANALRHLGTSPATQEMIAERAAMIEQGLFEQTDVLHYDLEIEILPSQTRLIGSNTMTIRAVADGVSSFDFQLDSPLATTELLVNGAPAAWVRLSPSTIRVTLDRAYQPDEQFTITVGYNGIPVSRGFGSINFTSAGGQPSVFTLSEPYYSHTWWPVKDDNNDKATADLRFIVPSNLTVASNGLLLGTESLSGSRSRFHWKTEYQTTPYLFCFSAAVYNEFTDVWNYGPVSMPLQYLIYPGSNTASNRNAWLITNDMLTVFSDLFGVYPFHEEKYGIYQFGFGGGMEHQTFSGQGGFSASLTAHELGHQWWGDMITCATWSDIWLNEGFATYSEALWEEFKPGSSGTAALVSAMNARRPTQFGGTVYVFTTTDPSRIFSTNYSYRKGAWVVHMLRYIVGDETFFDILSEYRERYAYKTATTEQFIAVAEEVAGRDLRWFFDPWLFELGAPTYRYAWRNVNAGGRAWVEVYVNQNQSASWATFSMPIDVTTRVGGVDVPHTVFNTARAQHFLLPVNASATTFAFNINSRVLATSQTTTTFVESPPKIIGVSPEPGAALDEPPTEVRVTFHKNVNLPAGSVFLAADGSGPVAATLSYNAATFTAILTPLAPLESGAYTITVQPSITGVAGGQSLDGEVAGVADPASLPTGDGLPGGQAVFVFTAGEIEPFICAGDANGDKVVNGADLSVLLSNFGTTTQPGDAADFNSDGVMDGADLSVLLANFGTTCR